MSRLINCLNGFTPLVNITIDDNQQIGNIIVLIKEQLDMEANGYNVQKHKERVEKELTERGYPDDVITEWISYIE